MLTYIYCFLFMQYYFYSRTRAHFEEILINNNQGRRDGGIAAISYWPSGICSYENGNVLFSVFGRRDRMHGGYFGDQGRIWIKTHRKEKRDMKKCDKV